MNDVFDSAERALASRHQAAAFSGAVAFRERAADGGHDRAGEGAEVVQGFV